MKAIIGSTCALVLAMSLTGCASTSSAPATSNNNSNLPANVHRMTNEMVEVMKLDKATTEKLLQLNLRRHNRFYEIQKSDKNERQKKAAIDANFRQFMASVEEITTPAQMHAWRSRNR